MNRIWYSLFFILVVSLSSFAGNGKIVGKVTDNQTKEALIGATVQIVGTSFGSSTDINGQFIILSVPSGEYSLKASYIGYQEVIKSGIRVSSDLTTEINFVLTSSSVELKPMEIVAERPMFNKSATNIVRIATKEELENLPVRGVVSAVALQPGIVMQEERGNQRLYIRGGRADEVGYYVEGVSTRNILTGENVTNIIPEALEEFQVHAGGYTAEYGGSNAGIIRQQLRSGTSNFKTTLQMETDNFNLGEGFFEHTPNKKFLGTYSYGYSDYVMTLSGPIVTDKIKLFIAGQNQFQRDTYVRFIEPFRFENLIDENSPVANPDTVKVLELGPGNIPGTMKNKYSLNGTLTFDYNPYLLRIGTTYTWQLDNVFDQRSDIHDSPITHLFNGARIPSREIGDGLFNVKFTHFLSTTTFYEANLNYFDQRAKTYDPLFEDNYLKYKDSVALAALGYHANSNLAEQLEDYSLNDFQFDHLGKSVAMYSKAKQNYLGGTFDLTSQVSSHEFKIGGSYQYYTVRGYYVGRRPGRENLLTDIINFPDLYRSPSAYDPLTGSYERDVLFQKAGDYISAYGYDVYGNEIDDGFDGPKHPEFAALYFQDKLELSDLVVKAGFRLDIIDSDDKQFRDFIDYEGKYGEAGRHYGAGNPLISQLNDQIIPDGMEKKPAFKQVSPRLGLSFPVSDRTTFHLQYGKFLQAPQLSTLYAGRGISAVMFGGSYFVPTPIGYGLDPERTTQYEVGFTQQISDYAVFDITGFYKDIQGQIQITKIVAEPNASIVGYNTLQNGDYATTKGLEFKMTLRRTNRIQAQINYTMSDAQGTGSNPYSAVGATETGTIRPTVISPLDFNQAHRGTMNFDYRFGENDGGPILSRLGANLLLTFNSGHSFTRAKGEGGQRPASQGAILADDDPRNRTPIEPIGASTTPWFFNFDLRVDKSIDFGPIDMNIYVYVQNLLNTQNVVNVYSRTGNAYDDGYLSNPDLSGTAIRTRGQQFVDMYRAINIGNRQHYALTQGGDLFGPPRQIRLGVRLEY
ncbi:MAG: TonB-dependent receptor [Ignavibacteriae bacterium]|nr:TonB-dependent receptor [Ignavibacteriota bacterium]